MPRQGDSNRGLEGCENMVLADILIFSLARYNRNEGSMTHLQNIVGGLEKKYDTCYVTVYNGKQ